MSTEKVTAKTESDVAIDINSDQASDSNKKKKKKPTASVKDYLRVFTFADRWDWTLNTIAAVTATASGALLALYV